MKIGILGTGVVGQTIAEKLVQLGHDVMMGTRDKKATLAKTSKDNFGRPPFGEWLKNNSKVKFGTYSEAASFGEFLVNATSGIGSIDALKMAGENKSRRKSFIGCFKSSGFFQRNAANFNSLQY